MNGESREHEGQMANQFTGQALSDSPALKPYRGKPAVRNFRGGDGNVGIIRSPVRAIALPDNRHVVGDARARAAMLADIPVGESPIGGSAQLPP